MDGRNGKQMEKLCWSRDRFKGNKLIITDRGETVGAIERGKLFYSEATAVLNGRRFFLKRDFLLFKFEIYDANNQTLLGTVILGPLNSRSELLLNGKRFVLEINNFQQTNWCWRFDGQRIITYKAPGLLSKARGEAELFIPETEELEILLLLGMFIRNQFILMGIVSLILLGYIIFL